jgi:hypothetical protein
MIVSLNHVSISFMPILDRPRQSMTFQTTHTNPNPSQPRLIPIRTQANQDSYQSDPKPTKTYTNLNPRQPILSLLFLLSLYAYIALALDLGFNTSARTQKKFQKFLNWNISIKLGVLAGIGRDYIPLPLALQKLINSISIGRDLHHQLSWSDYTIDRSSTVTSYVQALLF